MLIAAIVYRYLSVISCHSLRLSRAFCDHLSFFFSSPFLTLLTIFQGLEIEIDQLCTMEFLQESTFTVFLALVLTFIVAKIVSFSVSNSTSDVNNTVSSVGEGAVAKEVTLERELKVRRRKGGKRVKFVDDVFVIRRIDHYEGSENLVLLDDAREVGDVIVEEMKVDEKSGDNVDLFGDDGLGEDHGVRKRVEECSDLREINDADAQFEGCENTERLIEKEVVNENVETLVTSGVRSEEELGGNDVVIDEREGNGEREEVVTGDVRDEEKVRDESVDDEDDDWEGIERSELEKVFAEAVNYVEYGGKDKGDDRLAKLGSDAQMQLYGLHKVAVEGPCREPQPMALLVSARGKWNSWQGLGSMSQEVAMEQYIKVLSENIPEWMHEYSADDDMRKMETKDEISVSEDERKSELSNTAFGDSSTCQSSVDKVAGVVEAS